MPLLRIFNISIFTLWIIFILILIYREEKAEIIIKDDVLKTIIKTEEYCYDLFKDGKKIGYKMITKERIGNEIILKSYLKTVEKDTTEKELKIFTDTSLRISSFEFTLKEEKEYRKINGKIDGNDLILLIESTDKREARKLTINKDIFFDLTYIPSIVNEKPVKDQIFKVSVFDPLEIMIKDIDIKIAEISPIKAGLNVGGIYRLLADDKEIWANENGIIIKEEVPHEGRYYLHLKAFREKESDFLFLDYTELLYFKSDKVIPSESKLLKVKIKGIKIDPEIYRDSDVIPDNDILTIKATDIEEIKKVKHILPFKDDKLNIYLLPTKWISSDYGPLKDTGLIYARSNNYDALKLTEYLNSYLFNLIVTSPQFFIHSSKDILESLKGEAIERALMFATYARAAGLPTRLTGGVVYIKGYFYPHVWNEVWLGKWVPVDSTIYEFPAKITHIPLFKDKLEDIIKGIKDLQDIKIEILEVS